MIPIADENPVRRVPWVTILLIVACTVVFVVVQPSGRRSFDMGAERLQDAELRFALDQAAIPCEVVRGRPLSVDEVQATFDGGDLSACGVGDETSPAVAPGKSVYAALLVSMFLHGNLAHLFGNMLFLWVFGNNIEDRKGPWWYLAVYLAAGVAASFAHIAIDPDSTVPVVGASGAIAGLLGAYLVWFPRARVKCMIPLLPFVLFRKVSTAWVLGLWLAQQFLLVGASSEVAWAAHVGGFVFGAGVGLIWRRSRSVPPTWAPPDSSGAVLAGAGTVASPTHRLPTGAGGAWPAPASAGWQWPVQPPAAPPGSERPGGPGSERPGGPARPGGPGSADQSGRPGAPG